MPIQVKINDGVNLAELMQLKLRGYMVEETPHIGNLSVSTLALMSLGMVPKLVDVTIGERDNLFYPHCLIRDGESSQIASANLMTTHNKMDESGLSISEFHTQPLKDLNLAALVHSQWVIKNKDLVSEVISMIVDKFPLSMWKRYVTANGTILPKQALNRNELIAIHKVTVDSDAGGWVIPNPVNILLDIVCGARETEKEKVYMLSGQSMYKYIVKGYDRLGPMDKLISEMYDMIRNSAMPGLPKDLEVSMVPITELRHFVAPNKQKHALDAKLKYFMKQCRGNARCGNKLTTLELNSQQVVRFRKKRQRLFQKLSNCLSLVCAPSESGIFYTQHDLVQNRDMIYIPDHVLNTPIKNLIGTAERMSKLAHLEQER